jgi:hypothetical protein
MKTITSNQTQHLTFQEYKNAFKKTEKTYWIELTSKANGFLNETKFFIKFAFIGILFITLLALLTAF